MKNLTAPILSASQVVAGAGGLDGRILRNLTAKGVFATSGAIIGQGAKYYPLATAYEFAAMVLLHGHGLPFHVAAAAFQRAAALGSGRDAILEALALGKVAELSNAPCQPGPSFWVLGIHNASGAARDVATLGHLIRTDNPTVAINEICSARGGRIAITLDVKRLVADVDRRLFNAGVTIPLAPARAA